MKITFLRLYFSLTNIDENRLLFITLFLLLINKPVHASDDSISFRIDGLADTLLQFGGYIGGERYIIDTAFTNAQGEGSFKLENSPQTGLYFLLFPDNRFLELVIDDFSGLYLSTSEEKLIEDITIQGNKVAAAHVSWMQDQLSFQNEVKKLRKAIRNKKLPKDSLSIYWEKIRQFEQKENALTQDYIDAHADDFFSVFLKASLSTNMKERVALTGDIQKDSIQIIKQLQVSRNSFFANYNFSNPGLTRTPIFPVILQRYFRLYPASDKESIIADVENILAKSAVNQVVYQFTMQTLFNFFQHNAVSHADDAFLHLAEKYYIPGKLNWTDEAFRERIQKKVSSMRKNRIGEVLEFPAMEMLDGKVFNIGKVRRVLYVIYFWDTDCRLCRKDLPVLWEIKWNFRKDNMDVIAVYAGKDKHAWKAYVDEHNLDWVNVWDPYNMSQYRENLNVMQTPQYYIIDIKGVILDKGYSVYQIREFLNEYLR